MNALPTVFAFSFATMLAAGVAYGASPEEVKQLGSTLTPFGAEVAGNKEGTIPPYDQNKAAITPPSGYKPGSGVYLNPFADEKPLFTITAANMSQYKDKLDEGAQTLLKRWPDTYKINVYPTHRTAVYPKWVLDNTLKNATIAKLLNDKGDGVEGAYAGVPFPIPKNGLEALWNNILFWRPVALEELSTGYLVDSNGQVTNVGTNLGYYETQYYNKDKDKLEGPIYYKSLFNTKGPARQAGEASLVHYSLNYATQDQITWSYSPGQRRVRLAPEFKYDTPSPNYGGGLFWDEIQLFSGRPDRFDWKLIGKKEMYIPYNGYDVTNSTSTQVLGKQHPNPDRVRWELHRVWEVDATLKAGERHAYKTRKIYIDEDSWRIVAAIGYDQAGQVYRVGHSSPWQAYSPEVQWMYGGSFWIQDLQKNQYLVTPIYGGENGFLRPATLRASFATTPGALQGTGVR
ncbi:DUF1329 domain-containing protein [Pseudomonas sp. BF-R-19]|uniref:DUF1329 domain-containing protein n=1 Tax=Pseudomonas sp. BF-R-19 TaxID=2832397 RepID=UPI001CBCD76D|nr:DUF1329 domain-containing protein [Pseudomonas sp. BF-R-19]